MTQGCEFDTLARLPMPGDNVAIALRRLEPGTRLLFRGRELCIRGTVMEGHRFAVEPLPAGAALLSWELPFGMALRSVDAGEYVCNQGMLDALSTRGLDFSLPETPNFFDHVAAAAVDPALCAPGRQVPLASGTSYFAGYARPGGRGVGTRNHIVVLGAGARAGIVARLLAARARETVPLDRGVESIVAVEHTEGDGARRPNNLELVLRTLTGFCVHPNVAAVLVVDYGDEPVHNRLLQEYAMAHQYPMHAVPHAFLTVSDGLDNTLAAGERQIRAWADGPARGERTRQPLSALQLALQCGGSDAFSGISGNPLAGWVARESIRHGGAANLAETDELMGGESYVLRNVLDQATAARFLDMLQRFRTRMAWHGECPAGNPSAGNKYRGIYNIVLKSIGAARKRDPEVRLDGCIEYAERIRAPGFWFMDSPGNDLESIAGQVASGCNAILFVTGNGSVTNFPFVPTLKFVTTTRRYEALSEDMDVNAGAYLDGSPMAALGRRTFDLLRAVVSGRQTCGERAGHSQVQVWRDWPRSDAAGLEALQQQQPPAGGPASVPSLEPPSCRLHGFAGPDGTVFDLVGLVFPTSLCSAQVARLAAERLADTGLTRPDSVRRFVALPHTEGCGSTSDELLLRAAMSYLLHPMVRAAVVVEHGCEQTHNDAFRHRLLEAGVGPDRFGWVSVQRDGGNQRAIDRVAQWFAERLPTLAPATPTTTGLAGMRLGLLTHGPLPAQAAAALGRVAQWVVAAGGIVVIPEGLTLPGIRPGTGNVSCGQTHPWPAPTSLPWAQRVSAPGLWVSQMPTDQWLETITGLAACGVDILVVHAGQQPLPGHPLVPLVQVSCRAAAMAGNAADLDLVLHGPHEDWPALILDRCVAVLGGRVFSRAMARGHVGLQVTRGYLGIST